MVGELIPPIPNYSAAYNVTSPFRLTLPDLLDLYKHLEAHINRRGVPLGPVQDPGTLFVKPVKTSSLDAEYDSTTFYEVCRTVIQRYGIYSSYTAEAPSRVCYRLALITYVTSWRPITSKKTVAGEKTSYAIQDTPNVLQQHCGRFLPRDKAGPAKLKPGFQGVRRGCGATSASLKRRPA